jgi:hypothetical protein
MDKILKNRKLLLLAAIVAVIVVPLAIWGISNLPSSLYSKTLAALEKDDVNTAFNISTKLSDNYKDSEQLKKYCKARVNSNGRVTDDYAYTLFLELGSYMDSAERVNEVGYAFVEFVFENYLSVGNPIIELTDAEQILSQLGDYKNSAALLEQIPELRHEARYNVAYKLYEQAGADNLSAYEEAAKVLSLSTYEDGTWYYVYNSSGEFRHDERYAELSSLLNEGYKAAKNQAATAEQEALRQQEIAEREVRARDSLELAKKSIVGTWGKGSSDEYSAVYGNDGYVVDKYADIGAEVKFLEDGTFETYQGNLVQTGRYYFEDIYLVIRMPAALLGGELETKYTIYMVSDTEMEITESGDSEIDNGILGTTSMTYHPTTYIKQ